MEETDESTNPYVSSPSGSARCEHVSIKALLKKFKDIARVLDRLMAPRAPIDSVRKHGVEEFHCKILEV